jgi:cytosine/adenosine deaminase-related metal-dependent hydrolase
MLPAYFSSADQLLTPALAVSQDPKVYGVARELGVRAVLHIRLNSASLVALRAAGVIRDGDEFIHCTHLNQDAWNVIREFGGRTSHSVPLEMAMGHGTPAIQEALDNGVRPSLSGDHATTVGMDMFGMMRAAFGMQRVIVHQRRRNGEEQVPQLVTPRQVLEFATINGARVASLDHKIGTITPGKDADLLMLRADRLDVWPINNAYAAVVNQMSAAHVDAVFVAGKPRKWDGQLVGVDHARVLDVAQRARDAVLARVGYQPNIVS